MLRNPLSEGRYHDPQSDRQANQRYQTQANAAHIEHLPLILAGPILRRTESNAVTVWVALKAPREVTLKVYATDAEGSIIKDLLLEGTHSTIPLGKHLHILAITAKPINERKSLIQRELHPLTPSSLKPGQIYAYDLSFGSYEQNLTQALNCATHSPQVTVSYFEHQLPTFAMPPSDLCDLRIAHGSCRKLHGGGQDALPILDDLIEHYAKEPNSRLHQLFFTGDQIYGDDVSDPLLWVATNVGDTLLGWEENLPVRQTSSTGYEYKKPNDLKPGQRSDIARDYCSFTAMLVNSPEKAKSHLFSLGEYCASYLLVWSPILWPENLPKGQDIYQDSKQAKQWNEEARHVKDCISQLWKVRRALANVPTYMICDDHDVNDDWYLNRAWCTNVLSKPLGRRVVHNALAAYAVFQAWGNTPEQFQERQPGGNLLKALTIWSASAGTDEYASEKMAKFLGLPLMEAETGLPRFRYDKDVLILDRDYPDGTLPIAWHYTVRSLKHEVIVLDTRTWRGYPQADNGKISLTADNAHAPPMLLCPTAFKQQIQEPLELTDQLNQSGESSIEVTLVIMPTNLVSLQIIDVVQQRELESGNVFNSDVGDAWNLNEVALSKLLAELFKRRQQVVVLSGDIHFAGAVRLSYWSGRHFEDLERESNPLRMEVQASGRTQMHRPHQTSTQAPPQQNSNARVLAQLTSSAFKNGELKTYFIHTKAKSLVLEQPQDWAGWNEPPQLLEIQVIQETVRVLDVEVPKTRPIVRQLVGAHGNWNIAWEIVLKDRKSLPDWRYHIEWVKRQKAIFAPWEGKQMLSALSKNKNPFRWLKTLGSLVSLLWRNQWLQEGEEVVGRNNFGVISFEWPQNKDEAKAVIQDSYWQSPWQPSSVVYSRYFVPLQVDSPPPSPRVISKRT